MFFYLYKRFNSYFFIILGTAFMAISTQLLLLPNKLSTGGFSGIGTIIYYYLGIPIEITTIVLNIPLIIVAYSKIGKSLFYKSIFGIGMLSLFFKIFENMNSVTNDHLLASIFGGILMGTGTALILKSGASTGGTDLLSYIIRSFNKKFRSSALIIFIDFFIVVANMICFFAIEVGMYSVIAIFFMGKMIDILFEGVYFTKVLYIVSDKHGLIAEEVGNKIKRGSTGIYSKGMYSNEEKIMLFCVASRREVFEIKNIVKNIDPNAFIVISNAVEALGKGFTE